MATQTKETEPKIRIRLANCSDVKQLADLHYLCSLDQPGGFMHKLGRRFLVAYYRIVLSEPMSLVLCADGGTDGIVGLVSASLDARAHLQALREGRYKLLFAVLPALIRQPKLIKAVSFRKKSLSVAAMGEGFIVGSGARVAYWGWLPNYPSGRQSIRLLQTLLWILGALGASAVQLEVDRVNRKVEVVHRLLGAKVVREFATSDGRVRLVMEHDLDAMCRKTSTSVRRKPDLSP